MSLGSIDLTLRPDGGVAIGEASPSVQFSLGLIVQLAAASVLTMRDGLIVLSGVDAEGSPREVVYRVVAMRAAENAAADEGGWLTCDRTQ